MFRLTKKLSIVLSAYMLQISALTIVPISIPKCGTHLTLKCLNLLGIEPLSIDPSIDMSKNPEERLLDYLQSYNLPLSIHFLQESFFWNGYYPLAHMMFSESNQKAIPNNFKVIFTIRDPRDRLVSAAFWIKKHPQKYFSTSRHPIGTILEALIDRELLLKIQGQEKFADWRFGGWQYSVNFYKNWLGWLTCPNICLVKFENLVGSKGGGNDELQKLEIEKIALHCGLDLAQVDIAKIAKALFGDEAGTFRNGQIGSWKTHFTQAHKEAFKKNTEACQIIIDLGYEPDNSWLD